MNRLACGIHWMAMAGCCWHGHAVADVTGRWLTRHDSDGQPLSVVRIEQQGDEYVGFIEQALHPSHPTRCDFCSGERAQQPVVGLKFVWGLRRVASGLDGGRILDPGTGSVYSLKAVMSPDGNVLTITGYVGTPLLGRSQSWQRVR